MDGTAIRPGRGPTWWRRIVALTLLVAVAAVLGGEGEPASAGRRAAPTDPSAPFAALFVGDSIMRSAVGELQLRLVDRSAGWATAFAASGGMGVDDSPYVGPRISAASTATGGFDVIVVNLGANDVLEGYVTANPGSHITRILDAAGTTPVLWLDQAETLPRRTAAVAFNDALEAAVATHPNASVVRWGAVLDAHREYLDPDELHLNAQGQAALAQVIADAVDQAVS